MQKKKSYKMAGIFVLLGFLCLGAIIFNYVRNKFISNEEDLVVMYFDESIKGLSVGSPIVFKGVEVGKVARINLLIDLENENFKTSVFGEFLENKSFKINYSRNLTIEEDFALLIKRGLRARLVSASYLTGQLMIELFMDPSVPEEYKGTGRYAEIPTSMSSFEVISKDLQEIPLKDTMLRLSDIVMKIDKNLPGVLEVIDKKFPEIMNNMEQITQKMNSTIDKKSHETSKAVANFNATMEDMGKASVSLKNLADFLERHPEAIIRGKEDNQ